MIAMNNNRLLVGRMLLISAGLMGALALAFYSGVIPLSSEDARVRIAMVIGAVAVLDGLLAAYFTATGQ